MTDSGPLRTIGPGIQAPPFDLPAADGERFSLESFSTEQLLVVFLLANHCPHLSAWESQITTVAVEFSGRGAAFVAVSCGDPLKYAEDGIEAMRRVISVLWGRS